MKFFFVAFLLLVSNVFTGNAQGKFKILIAEGEVRTERNKLLKNLDVVDGHDIITLGDGAFLSLVNTEVESFEFSGPARIKVYELQKNYSKVQSLGKNIDGLYETQKTLAVYHNTTSIRIVWPLKYNIVVTGLDGNLCLEWIDLAFRSRDLYELFVLNQHADTVFSKRTNSSVVNISLKESFNSIGDKVFLIGIRKVNEPTQKSRIHEFKILESCKDCCPKMKASD